MLWQTPRPDLMQMTKYERILIWLFRRLVARDGVSTLPLGYELAFNINDILAAMHDAVVQAVITAGVNNVPDIKYTFDARRELPPEVEQCGPMTWMQAGKGMYRLKRTLRPNIIDFAQLPVPATEPVADQTPPYISALLGNDEQAVFTRVRNADLISTVLGFKAWPIQGHHRTTVSYGQVEVDEVQAGIDGGKHTVVPISGKGGQDKLSWSQALNLNTYAAEKPPMPGLQIRSIGLWRDHLNTVWIVEFSPHTDIDQIQMVRVRRFKFQ